MNKLIILEALKKRKAKEEKNEEPEEDYGDLSVAAEDILSAVKNKDPEELAMALKSFVDMC